MFSGHRAELASLALACRWYLTWYRQYTPPPGPLWQIIAPVVWQHSPRRLPK